MPLAWLLKGPGRHLLVAEGHYGPVAANLPKDQLGVSSAGTEKGGVGNCYRSESHRAVSKVSA